MRREKKLNSELPVKIFAAQMIFYMTVAFQILVFLISGKMNLFPSQDALMNIISSFAEIIAGLYGTTLAGYTFFLSRIDALAAADTTLDFVTDSIKKRFKYLIWYITFNVLMTLLTSAVLMYCPAPEGDRFQYFYRLLCNEFVVFLGFSVVLILYYSVLVIDPNCIQKEAAKLKKKLAPGANAGSAIDFIGLYDEIEEQCSSLLPERVLRQIHDNKGKQFEYTVELLREYRPELRMVLAEVKHLHRYYTCVVNYHSMSVSKGMCDLARAVLNQLKQAGEVNKKLPKR